MIIDLFPLLNVIFEEVGQLYETKHNDFGLELPMVYQAAVVHLLGRKFEIHSLVAIMMDDEQIAKYENYILTSPPFFL